jgi:pimeloyl-ACP methyl ester carboxylesterase
VCFERFAVDHSIDAAAYFRCLADAITLLTGGEAVELVGFSVGAFVALHVYCAIPRQVSGIQLVSAAAPLADDSLWKTAAGRGVFRLAQTQLALFRRFCGLQGWAAKRWPEPMLNALFAGTAKAERDLLAQPAFCAAMLNSLRAGLGRFSQGYARDVLLYVQPWQALLSEIHAPTCLWHGEQDTWAPLAMADYLQSQLPNVRQYHGIAGLAHYSCLLKSAEALCWQIAENLGQ